MKLNRLVAELMKLHDRKNHDYAKDDNPYSNFEEAAAFANVSVETVFLVLLGIKFARLRELTTTRKTPRNEATNDTRQDAAMYALLWASYCLEA